MHFNLKTFAKFISLLFFANFFATKSYSFSGGMNAGGMGGSGNSSIKSGISIVDPNGKSLNCQPFVDKKWESTDFSNSWSGVYFSVGAEYSKFSGDFKVNSINKAFTYFDDSVSVGFNENKRNFKIGGSGMSPFVTVGGGMLIDRVYLATDLEIRVSNLTSSFNVLLSETYKDPAKDKNEIPAKLEYTIKNYVIYNAKIGYLITDRTLLYLNAGLGSFSSYDISLKGYSTNIGDSSTSPPIRLSLGSEFALSNHFRIYGDLSYWVIPPVQGNFTLKKSGSSSGYMGSEVSFSSKVKINSTKLGILYRF